MNSRRAAELRAKREKLEELRRKKAEAEAAHEARFGPVSQAADQADGRSVGQSDVGIGELEELFAEALRRRVTTESSIDTMRHHIATGRFSPQHYIGMWRGRLGLTVTVESQYQPVTRRAQQPGNAHQSLDSLRRQRDAEDGMAAHAQTELQSTLSQISAAERAGSRRKKPPPPLPPPPSAATGPGERGEQGLGPMAHQQPGQDDLLAAIRGGVAQRAARRVDVSQLEGQLQDKRDSGGGADAHLAQLSDALSGLRLQVGPRGVDSDETDSDDIEDGDAGWLSDDGDETMDATRHYWARPRVLTAPPATSAIAPAPASARVPAKGPPPALAPEDTMHTNLPPGIRLNRSALSISSQSRTQEPEWLPQRKSSDSAEQGDVDQSHSPSQVQQAQARVLSDPELHAILERRRATTDMHAIVVATPESVTAVGIDRCKPDHDNAIHHRHHADGTAAARTSRSTGGRSALAAAVDPPTYSKTNQDEPRSSPWESGGIYDPDTLSPVSSPPVQRASKASVPMSDAEVAVIDMGFDPEAVRRVQAGRALSHGGAGYAHADELLSALLEADEQVSGGACSGGSTSGHCSGVANHNRCDRGGIAALEQERADLLRAQREYEFQQVKEQIAERQATYDYLKSSVSGHQLHTMAAEMESLMKKQSMLEAQLARGKHTQGGATRAGAGRDARYSRTSTSDAAETSVLVQIPPHIGSGQQLQVTLPDGRPFIFIVPPGVSEGQSVEVSVPPPDRVLRVQAQPAVPASNAGSNDRGWRNAAASTLNRLGKNIKSPRGQSETRAKYQRKLEEREATLRMLQSMGENTAVVEREIKAMRAIIEGAEVGGSCDDPELALAKAVSLTHSESEASVLTKEEKMLEEAIEASHRSAVEDEVRRKEFLAEQIGQLEALLHSEKEAQRSAAADWPPITRELRTEYNSHFIRLCGHGSASPQSTVSVASVVEFLRLSKLSDRTLREVFDLTVTDHTRGVDAEEFMLAMHLTKGATRGVALPARLPAHLVRGGQGDGESERILELEAALASARAEAAQGPGTMEGNTPPDGDEGLHSKLQEMQAALAAARYEKQLLENERAEMPAMGAVMASSGGAGLSEQEVAALRAKVALLQKQLSDLQTEEDSDEWDGALESAQKALREAAERLMEGDESAQSDFDKWDKRISTHPDHLAAEARKLAEWERKERPNFAEALTRIRGLVPPDILRTTRRHLEAAGMPEALLKRLWDKRVLWFVRMQPTAIAKLHMADLATKYSYHGCDITECRAVFAMLPGSFENDADGAKEQWRKDLRDRLMELGEKEEQGTLRGAEQQHPSYKHGVGEYRHVAVAIPPPGVDGTVDLQEGGAADAGASDAFNAGAAAQRELEMLRGKGLGGIKLPSGQQQGGFKKKPGQGRRGLTAGRSPPVEAAPRGAPPPPGPPPPPGALPDRRTTGPVGGDGRNDLLAAIAARRID